MPGNANYTVSGYSAFGVEQVLKRDWTNQLTGACALLACIKDRDLNWKKGYEVDKTGILVPILYDDISGLTTSNIGVADASEVPSAWPTWDATTGFTHARYEWTHFRRPMTILDSESKLAMGGARGDLMQGKTDQLMAKFKALASDQIEGESNASSRTKLLGLNYAVNTANTVGGIDQSSDTWWRGGVNSAVGTLSLPVIDNAYDSILRYANMAGDMSAPDLLMLSFNGSNTNVYGKMRSLIAPAERFEHADFKAKYGIANFVYMGMKCVQSQRMVANSAMILSTASWFYAGNEYPKAGMVQRIPGSDVIEHMYTMWCAVGCNEIRRNYKLLAITG